MSAGTNNDSGDALPGHDTGHPNDDAPAIAAGPDTVAAKPKSKPKRPKPCFDDGSLTRVFKFPSKAYPKSSHYVTGDEIIIRIRKARKKWKLVVPKKRVRSYKTNRWFAKKRWVEIEITFTQALRLGLVEPRKPAEVAVADALPAPQTAGEFPSESGPVVMGASADTREMVSEMEAAPLYQGDVESETETETETETEAGSDTETDPESDDDTDEAEQVLLEDEPDDAEHLDDEPEAEAPDDASGEESDTVSVVSEPPSFNAEPEPAPRAGAEVAIASRPVAHVERPNPAAVPTPLELQPVAMVPQRPGCEFPKRRSHGYMAIAASGLLLISAAGVWLELDQISSTQVADSGACAHAGVADDCANSIVTGAIGSIDSRHDQEAERSPPASNSTPPEKAREPDPEPVTVVEIPEPHAPEIAKLAMSPPEEIDEQPLTIAPGITAPVTEVPAKVETEPTPPTIANAAMAVAPARPPGLPHIPQASPDLCRDLGDMARSVNIRFEFASASLHPSVLSALDSFAGRLRSCPTARVLVEGHTDSDGHADRNQALSQRRADVVRQHLVDTGVRPAQASAIGFGQSRPDAPNDTPENRRWNRRAALVVEQPH